MAFPDLGIHNIQSELTLRKAAFALPSTDIITYAICKLGLTCYQTKIYLTLISYEVGTAFKFYWEQLKLKTSNTMCN